LAYKNICKCSALTVKSTMP